MTYRLPLLAFALIALAEPAFAQLGGAGGVGLLAPFITFLVNLLMGLIAIGVLYCGVRLLFGHHDWATIAGMALGAIIIANYTTIVGFFQAAG